MLVAPRRFAAIPRALKARLHARPKAGPLPRDWTARRAVPFRAKIAALGGMSLGWSVLGLSGVAGPALAALAVLFVAAGAYVATRPDSSDLPTRA